MTKYVLGILILFSYVAFANEFIDLVSKKDCMFFYVNEKTYYNGKIKEKEYNLKLRMSDNTLYKEILAPKNNKGETYLYSVGKKTVYYPMLNQIVEKQIENEENYLMKVIKDIRKIESSKIIENKISDSEKTIFFDSKNGLIKKIEYSDENTIEFSEYKNNLPSKINIFDGEKLTSKIEIKKIDLDVIFSKKDFEIQKK